jgi:hypothetical protein
MNEPLPWQLTVAQLREVLATAPDEAIVALRVPAPGLGHADLDVFCNLKVERSAGMIVLLAPELRDAEPFA